MNNKFGVAAAREHLLSGDRFTRLEAIVLYGVPDLTKVISDLRRDGYTVLRETVPLAAALLRVNRVATVIPPAALPVRDVLVTEYRVSR